MLQYHITRLFTHVSKNGYFYDKSQSICRNLLAKYNTENSMHDVRYRLIKISLSNIKITQILVTGFSDHPYIQGHVYQQYNQ